MLWGKITKKISVAGYDSRNALKLQLLIKHCYRGTKNYNRPPYFYQAPVITIMKPILNKIKREFSALPTKKQRDILGLYADYVEEYPDDHDEGSYPVCFWEWFSNDYVEGEVVIYG